MSFEFVNTSTDRAVLTSDDRAVITRRARRAAAASRRGRNDNRTLNTLQLPDFLLNSEQNLASEVSGRRSSTKPTADPVITKLRRASPHVAGQGMLTTPLALQPTSSIPTDLAILVKSTLTQDIITCAAGMSPNSDLRRWVKIIQLVESPLLRSLVKLYGHSTCLNAAAQCVAQRLRYCLEPDPDVTSLASAYDKAIRKLSYAIEGGTTDWTVWYSTLLLALFELLDQSKRRAWIMHSNGAFRILQALGPEKIRTETDKDIFIAQIELMILEAIFTNATLFLEQPMWRSAIESAATNDVNHQTRSTLVVAFWKIAVYVPGLLKSVTDVVMDANIHLIAPIALRLEAISTDLLLWSKLWAAQRPKLLTAALGVAMEMKCFTFLALIYRSSAALSVELRRERKAQLAAEQIISLAQDQENGVLSASHTKVSLQIAHSVLRTSAQWTAAAQTKSDEMVSPDLLGQWFAEMGRATVYAGGCSSCT